MNGPEEKTYLAYPGFSIEKERVDEITAALEREIRKAPPGTQTICHLVGPEGVIVRGDPARVMAQATLDTGLGQDIKSNVHISFYRAPDKTVTRHTAANDPEV